MLTCQVRTKDSFSREEPCINWKTCCQKCFGLALPRGLGSLQSTLNFASYRRIFEKNVRMCVQKLQMNHKWILSLPENSPTDCSIRKKKHGNLKASQHLAFKSHENVEIGSTCKKISQILQQKKFRNRQQSCTQRVILLKWTLHLYATIHQQRLLNKGQTRFLSF